MEFNILVSIGGALKGSKKVSTPCMIGRSKEATLTVAHPAMSRKHCELFEEAGKLYLRDNSSLNGTLYHGEYVESPVPIQVGEEFTVGELTFKIAPPAAPLTEQQKEIADRPTAPISIQEEAPADPGMATIMEQPKPADEQAPPKKGGKKVAPTDVRIVT